MSVLFIANYFDTSDDFSAPPAVAVWYGSGAGAAVEPELKRDQTCLKYSF